MLGKPALIRLHCAADYPTPLEDRYQIDQEGQAILIVGHDDNLRQFAIIDPYPRGHSQNIKMTWIDFDELEITMVDASKGAEQNISPLDSKMTLSSGNDLLKVSVGFPFMRGTFMDHDSIVLERVSVSISMSMNGKKMNHIVSADEPIRFGHQFYFELPLTNMDSGILEVHAETTAELVGVRPYAYRDSIGISHKESFNLKGTAKLIAAN